MTLEALDPRTMKMKENKSEAFNKARVDTRARLLVQVESGGPPEINEPVNPRPAAVAGKAANGGKAVKGKRAKPNVDHRKFGIGAKKDKGKGDAENQPLAKD
jgi:hypothetical protein